MIEWATAAGPQNLQCLTPELAKKFNIDAWYNTEDGGTLYPAGEPWIAPDRVGVLSFVVGVELRGTCCY